MLIQCSLYNYYDSYYIHTITLCKPSITLLYYCPLSYQSTPSHRPVPPARMRFTLYLTIFTTSALCAPALVPVGNSGMLRYPLPFDANL